jgi:transcriptional regulator with XRE-family HTH domain
MSKLSNTKQNVAAGQRLMAIREGSGLTQEDFAKQLGLSLRAYANYERGEREIPTALFRALSEIYRIDPLWQLVGPGEQPVHIGERVIDLELLEGVIQLVEEYEARNRRTLKPARKARIIRLGYEHCIAKGQVDGAHLLEMLSLAA